MWGLGVRKCLFKCHIWSVLWVRVMDNKQEYGKRLEAAEMMFWRKILRITWTEKLANELVLEKVGTETQTRRRLRLRLRTEN